MRIRLGLLRALLKENKHLLGPEDIENDDELDGLKWALKLTGTRLIPTGRSELGKIGAGGYGNVYEVVHDGDRRAMKVTEANDTKAYAQIQNVYSGLDVDARKALPVIYFTSTAGNTGVVIMELLSPLSSGELVAAFGRKYKHQATIIVVSEIMRVIKTNWKDWLVQAIETTNFQIPFGDLSTLESAIETAIDSESRTFKRRQGIDRVMKSITSVVTTAITDTLGRDSSELALNWQSIATRLLQGSFSGPVDIPYRATKELDPDQAGSEATKQLIHRLNVLQREGIIWEDVHEDNVLMRPATGELVVADVGLFEFGTRINQ